MADSDQSISVLRFNQISGALEGFGGGSPQWTQLTLTNTDPTQVPVTRTISTTAPLAGGGDLSANRTLSIPVASGSTNGYLSSTDWTTFNGKQTAGSYITALTGDVTASGPGSAAATVASTAAVKTLHADASGNLTGNVQLVSGTNVTLSQVGQAITINATGGSGITTLTGDVTAGPGSGSQAATVVSVTGVTDGSNAAAGKVGEYISAVQTPPAAFQASGTYGDLLSLALTAGDWDVSATIQFQPNGGSTTEVDLGFGLVPGNDPGANPVGVDFYVFTAPTAMEGFGTGIAGSRLSISSPTTIYLKYFANYTVATPQAAARFSARRVR